MYMYVYIYIYIFIYIYIYIYIYNDTQYIIQIIHKSKRALFRHSLDAKSRRATKHNTKTHSRNKVIIRFEEWINRIPIV